MWVELVPRRPDFCGCVGCPLCYGWADLTGVEKMAQDLLGRPATPEECTELEGAAVAIHEANLTRRERVLQEVDEAEKQRCTAIEVEAMLEAKRREKPPAKKTVVLDHVDMGKVEKDTSEKARKWVKQRQEVEQQQLADTIRMAQELAMRRMQEVIEREQKQREAEAFRRWTTPGPGDRFAYGVDMASAVLPQPYFLGETATPEPAPDRKAVEQDRLNYQDIIRKRNEERERRQASLAAFNPEPWKAYR